MSKTQKHSRRAFLEKTGGTALSSTLLRLALPSSLFVSTSEAAPLQDKKNLLTFSFPNGCPPQMWNYQQILSPLASLKHHLTVFQQIQNPVNIAGDTHEQGGASLFTGAINAGPDLTLPAESIDQIASKILDQGTALGSPLVTGVWRGFAGGVYRNPKWFRRSWKKLSTGVITPSEAMMNPAVIFRKLTSGLNAQEDALAKNTRKSILDHLLKEYQAVSSASSQLPEEVKQQLLQHFEVLRENELRLAQLEKDKIFLQQCVANVPDPDIDIRTDLVEYQDFERVFDAQIELMVLAFTCGLTHTGSMIFGCAGEGYVNTAVDRNHHCHEASHWGVDVNLLPSRKAAFIAYKRFYMQRLAKIMNRLQGVSLGSGKSLLDQTTIVAGTEFGDSETAHVANPIPLMIAGGNGHKGNMIKPCQFKLKLQGPLPSGLLQVFRKHEPLSPLRI